MPHLVLLYSSNLEQKLDFTKLCRTLADVMLEQRDETGKQIFPIGGTRVLAYPAAHSAIADGKNEYGFLYANLRIGIGRSYLVHKATGNAILSVINHNFVNAFNGYPIGITLQIDEGKNQVFDGKISTLHSFFNKDY